MLMIHSCMSDAVCLKLKFALGDAVRLIESNFIDNFYLQAFSQLHAF